MEILSNFMFIIGRSLSDSIIIVKLKLLANFQLTVTSLNPTISESVQKESFVH